MVHSPYTSTTLPAVKREGGRKEGGGRKRGIELEQQLGLWLMDDRL